ncbi:MAG: glycosyltransferase [Candidatus Competibacteraceae bacterium]
MNAVHWRSREELVRRGHRSVVISAGGRLVLELLQAGSEHLAWPLGAKSPLVPRWVRTVARWLAEQRIDILHARSRLPAWIAWLAWRRMDPATRPRFVTTVHGLYSVSRYSAIMTRRGERVIAVKPTPCAPICDAIIPSCRLRRNQVIQRGVDPMDFSLRLPTRARLAGWYRHYPQLRDVPTRCYRDG